MWPDSQLNLKDAAPGKLGADEEVTQIVFAAIVLVKRRLSQIFVQQQKGVEGYSALDFLCGLLLGSGAEVSRVNALYLEVMAQRRMQQLLVIIVLKDALGGEAEVVSIERGVLRFAAAAAAQLAQASGENQALRQRCAGGIAEGVPAGVGSEPVDRHAAVQQLGQQQLRWRKVGTAVDKGDRAACVEQGADGFYLLGAGEQVIVAAVDVADEVGVLRRSGFSCADELELAAQDGAHRRGRVGHGLLLCLGSSVHKADLGLPSLLSEIVAHEQQRSELVCAVGELRIVQLLPFNAAGDSAGAGVRQTDRRGVVLPDDELQVRRPMRKLQQAFVEAVALLIELLIFI